MHTEVIIKKLPVLVAIWLAAIAEVPACEYLYYTLAVLVVILVVVVVVVKTIKKHNRR